MFPFVLFNYFLNDLKEFICLVIRKFIFFLNLASNYISKNKTKKIYILKYFLY
jgi:hypothetical protein